MKGDDSTHVACESNYVQQWVIDQETSRGPTADVEKWLRVEGNGPGNKIEPATDAMSGGMIRQHFRAGIVMLNGLDGATVSCTHWL